MTRRKSARVLTAAAAIALIGAVFGALSGCSASHGPVSGQRAYDHTAKIVSFGPRPPGSENLRKVEGYIESELKAIDPKLELHRQTFTVPDRAPGVEFRNLWVQIPGKDPDKGPIVAIAAHYDSKIASGHDDAAHNFPFVGALDAAASCGVLLELAREIDAKHPIDANVWLIWLDGEESFDWDWNKDRALFGSQHFAATMAADKQLFPDGLGKRMRAFVLLDLLGDPELKIDKDTESHRQLLEIFADTAKQMGVGDVMHRYQSPMTDDHIPFKNFGVKVVDLIDFRFRSKTEHGPNAPAEAKRYTPWWHTADDNLSNVSAASLDIVGNLVWHALPKIQAEIVP